MIEPSDADISALRAKRAQLHNELRQVEQRAEQLRTDIDVIERAILLLSPTAQKLPIEKDASPSRMGKRGGEARAKKLTAERRSEIAKQAALKRWERN